MGFGDLPPDVLLRVLSIMRQGYEISYQYKLQLRAAAVCRQWRRVALSFAYGSVFIASTQGDLVYENDKFVGVAVRTNIPLVAAAGVTLGVKSVHFDLDSHIKTVKGLPTVLALMCTAARKWPAVQSFTLNASREYNRHCSLQQSIWRYDDELNDLCAAFVKLMPGIRRLKFPHINLGATAMELCGRLAGVYAGQLEDLQCRTPAILPPECRFTRLRNVHINCKEMRDCLPSRIDTTWLVNLQLSNISPWFLWTPFSNDDDSLDIEFPALHHLSLAFSDEYGDQDTEFHLDAKRDWRLRLPRLRSASISCRGNICPVLGHLLLPQHMDLLCFRVPTALFSSLADMKLPTVKRLELYVDRDLYKESSHFAFINRIVDDAHGGDEVLLSIPESRAPRPSDITCAGLTELVVVSLSPDALAALLEKLPRLVSLTLGYPLATTAEDAHVNIPEPGVQVIPLNTNLQRLLLGVGWYSHDDHEHDLQWKWMLLKIPSLKCFTVKTSYGNPVERFIKEYSPWHPHLASIVVHNCHVLIKSSRLF